MLSQVFRFKLFKGNLTNLLRNKLFEPRNNE